MSSQPDGYLLKWYICEKLGHKEEAKKAYEDFVRYAPDEYQPFIGNFDKKKQGSKFTN
ncbi:MAG: hypothetical protein JW734_10025 [Candidatus Omnitrophica bacterium]|nr:hypothetical protein [Candidatus Omnitrophota bacterium]